MIMNNMIIVMIMIINMIIIMIMVMIMITCMIMRYIDNDVVLYRATKLFHKSAASHNDL